MKLYEKPAQSMSIVGIARREREHAHSLQEPNMVDKWAQGGHKIKQRDYTCSYKPMKPAAEKVLTSKL